MLQRGLEMVRLIGLLLALALVDSSSRAQDSVVFTTLQSFGISRTASPNGLVQGSDGNFYGTTSTGGTGDHGMVFQLSTNGTLSTLYSFSGGADGGQPRAALVLGSDGNFYGTTYGGGASGNGTVFQISAKGTFTTLYSFNGGADGSNPTAGLVQGSDGNLYGTTSLGGLIRGDSTGYGTIFQISTNGVHTILYTFTDGADGPNGLVKGSDGNFYGTTTYGGAGGAGTVFQLSTNGTLTTLYFFSGGSYLHGRLPMGELVQGKDGNFYGTTYYAGGGRWHGLQAQREWNVDHAVFLLRSTG
jgi:uncharacterized repeat protein (TIGR03803 family)